MIPISRSDPQPVPATINQLTGAQPIANEIIDAGKNGVDYSQLKEGDILVMLGNYPSSCCICCFSLSFGASHTGVILRLDNKLWFVESCSFREADVAEWIGANIPTRQPSGVIASDIPETIKYYAACDVYRPDPPLSPEELRGLRRSFYHYSGLPYEKSKLQLINVGLGWPILPTENSLFCSELVARMFDSINRIEKNTICCCIPDWRRWNYDYRPVDIPNIIHCKRLGHMKGTRSIWDIRGWTFGLCG